MAQYLVSDIKEDEFYKECKKSLILNLIKMARKFYC